MAISVSNNSYTEESQTPLLEGTVAGAVDYKGNPVLRANSGGWRSASFMIGVEVAERFTYFGISCNLITYLTEQLGQSTVTAAENVNAWSGTAQLMPLLGASIADSFLGRYRTIVIATLIYILQLRKEDTSPAFRLLELINLMEKIQRSGMPKAHSLIGGFLVYVGVLRTYRYCIKRDETSPFVRIGGVFVTAVRNCHTTRSTIAIEEEACGTSHHSSEQFKFLNKALLSPGHNKEEGKVYTISEVEEAKAVLRLCPIWATSLVYAIVYAQASTFFTKQGATLDRTLFPGFKIPAASLQFFIGLAIVLFIPLYDRVFVPIAKAFTTKPSGITMLQRVGIGMLLSAACMVVAALVEIKRLNTAKELGLVDRPNVTIPMSVWWLVPQYVLSGIADVFTLVGLQEFFYDQVPSELRSVGIALCQSILGLGSLLSSLLVSVIEEATGGYGRYSWFSNNLNRAHLDYFYWLLAGLSVVAFAAYLYFAKSYIYKRPSTM
nr:protein nrt1/ ptr family 5.10 [Quercus suber]